MDGLSLIEPTELFNLLQEKDVYPSLSDPNFLLLLDCREREDYDEGHILSAVWSPRDNAGNFLIPFGSEIECKTNLVVYDSNTSNFKEGLPAVDNGNVLWMNGSRGKVKILKGGYELFSRLYPFLRTQKIMYTPQELDTLFQYPAEILPQRLYLGDFDHASDSLVKKHLNLKALVCCFDDNDKQADFTVENRVELRISDTVTQDILEDLKRVITFISSSIGARKATLVCSPTGNSRAATIVIAYLIQKGWDLERAFSHVRSCRRRSQPNSNFLSQLTVYEALLKKNDEEQEEDNQESREEEETVPEQT